jgi:tetratricopeptide (TPR) repeat protein
MNLALGRTEVGLEAFHQAALRRPDVMDTHIQYYKQLSNVGKLQEAGDYFDANISRAPDGDVVAICKYDITTGRLELAQPHLALLEKRGSVPDQVAAMKTFLLLAQGNATEARKNAEQTVQRYPSTYAALAPYFADLRP